MMKLVATFWLLAIILRYQKKKVKMILKKTEKLAVKIFDIYCG
jgi:hypothetical protein